MTWNKDLQNRLFAFKNKILSCVQQCVKITKKVILTMWFGGEKYYLM